MAPVCKFYQQGYCRNGANCKFEHPGASVNPFAAANTNRFNALNSDGGSGSSSGVNLVKAMSKYNIHKDQVHTDLTTERPQWILSAYGPGRDAPGQMFGGPLREQSFEEMRWLVMSSPNPQQALQQVQEAYQRAEQQMQTSVSNLDAAIEFVLSAENDHPNRHDICREGSQGGQGSGFGGNSMGGTTVNPFSQANTASPFGAPASSTTSAFGQPSALGQHASPFGSPAFGQPSQLGATSGSAFGAQGSAFGQPSQLGRTGGPAFGQPSSLGSTGGPAFGQPSQPGSTGGSAFGQPSQLGSTGTSGFGQPSTLGAKPNPFGASAAAPSGFAQAAQQGQGAFGQPSSLGQKPNPFASSSASPFGAPAQGQNAAPANPFGQAAQPSNAFGQPGPQNPFAAALNNTDTTPDAPMDTSAPSASTPANPFSQASQPSTGFGAATSAAANPFSQAQPQPQPQAQAQAQAQQPQNPYPPDSAKQHPPLESYATRANGLLVAFKGRPVVYNEKRVPGFRAPDGSWAKIWFPNGPPRYNKDTEPADPAKYDVNVKAAYETMAKNGRFMGDMPEVPPMRVDCVWDF